MKTRYLTGAKRLSLWRHGGWRVWPLTIASLSALGCVFGPSEERLACLSDCARKKDSCMIQATNSGAVQQCDTVGFRCSEVCPQ